MSDERKPLLSDEWLTNMAGGSYDYTLAWLAGDKVRNFYEDLITTNKLFPRSMVEGMLSTAMGVPKEEVWHELRMRIDAAKATKQ